MMLSNKLGVGNDIEPAWEEECRLDSVLPPLAVK